MMQTLRRKKFLIGFLISLDIHDREANHCPTVIKSDFSNDYIIFIRLSLASERTLFRVL